MMPASLIPGVDLTKAILQKLQDDSFAKKKLTVEVLRIDLIHPVISGNKWFKLKYHIEAAREQNKIGIMTFGGAYSNHLLATACACHLAGLASAAIVRGEKPTHISPTLKQAEEFGMQLLFVNRGQYKNKFQLKQQFEESYKDYYWVGEGGQSSLGIKGAAEIMQLVPINDYSHLLCAVGTGTMMAGLMASANPHQHVCGIPVLKIADPKNNEVLSFLLENGGQKSFSLQYQFHEGGYAKKTSALLSFMNELYRHYQLPTDFVYTGKLFRGVFELARKDFFPPGSKLLIIHSGGLQGNRSLAAGSLDFVPQHLKS